MDISTALSVSEENGIWTAEVGNMAKQCSFFTLPLHNVVELVFDASVFVDLSNYSLI
ncbi:hypothetical protein [Candidatus Nitrosocosmicus sp. R]